MSVLAIGSTGEAVTRLQQALVNAGYFVGAIDGDYGNKTAAAVAYLQSTHGLDIDGVAGPQVEEALDLRGSTSHGVIARWPTIETWTPADGTITVEIDSTGGADAEVNVVIWFRGPGGEANSNQPAQVQQGSTYYAFMEIPAAIAAHAGEVHFTGVVYDMHNRPLSDEGIGSFRIDLPATSGS